MCRFRAAIKFIFRVEFFDIIQVPEPHARGVLKPSRGRCCVAHATGEILGLQWKHHRSATRCLDL